MNLTIGLSRHIALATVCSVAVLIGCAQSPVGNSGAATASSNAARLMLPDLRSLRVKHGVSFTNSDRTRSGNSFDAGLPSSNIASGGGQLTFSPQAEGASDTLGDYAFAGYSFVLKGYSDDGVVHFFWATPPPDGQAWVALANHQSQHW